MSDINKVRTKKVPIKLADGKEYNLKFTLNALADLEEEYGSVDEAFAQMDKGSIKAVRFVMWAALSHSDEKLTVRDVGALIDMDSLHEMMAAVADASAASLPDEEVKTENGETAVPNV